METRDPTETGTVPDDFPEAWVISLKRTPERLAAFLRQNDAAGISFRRFEAVDGSEIAQEEAVRLGLIKPGTRWRTPATIGVAASHRKLWEATVAEGRPRLVFEDDVFIRNDFRAAFATAIAGLEAWDIVLAGYNTDALVEFAIARGFDFSGLFAIKHPDAARLAAFAASRHPAALFPLRHAFGISAYAVSPAGARKLLARCFPMDNRLIEFKATNHRFNAFSLDGMMNVVYSGIGAYVFVGPLALPLNDWERSTVDVRRR
jgi:GR25 family glycosyltransferase involved in LPS biosynthesis